MLSIQHPKSREGSRRGGISTGLTSKIQNGFGFTLVELIVVVAIIAMLMTVLVGGIIFFRERARSAQCQNNLRQIGVAIGVYAANSGGYFYDSPAGSGGGSVVDISAGGGGGIYVEVDGVVGVWDVGARYPDGESAQTDYGAQSQSAETSMDFWSCVNPALLHCPTVAWKTLAADQASLNPTLKGMRIVDDPNLGLIRQDDSAVISNYAYAVNSLQAQKKLDTIPKNVIAFIDWNAYQGWAAGLTYTTWQFSNPLKGISQDTPKGNNWWKTEVGFNHRSGGEACANFVRVDGAVGMVSSNDIAQSYFQ